MASEPVSFTIVQPTTRETAAVKARRLLLEGRVTVQSVRTGRIYAQVKGDTEQYEVRWNVNASRAGGWWSCSCEARGFRCSHIQAVQLITVPAKAEG